MLVRLVRFDGVAFISVQPRAIAGDYARRNRLSAPLRAGLLGLAMPRYAVYGLVRLSRLGGVGKVNQTIHSKYIQAGRDGTEQGDTGQGRAGQDAVQISLAWTRRAWDFRQAANHDASARS